MAKYFNPPPDYKPGIIFQLRNSLEGGKLRTPVLQLPQQDSAARREAVVLVHGFNNHYGEAATAYQGFRKQQYRLDTGLLPSVLEDILADAHWPGDAAWGVADCADFLVYPYAVGTARAAGPVLAKHLSEMPNLLIVHFIGHSLGCRVVLEAIRHLGNRLAVGKVCLMAAAVPVFQVETHGAFDFEGPLARAMRAGTGALILWSSSDQVLKSAFRIGQTMAAGAEGAFPIALGAECPPPTVLGPFTAKEVNGAGHSDYWGHQSSGAAQKYVAEYFKFGGMRRDIDARRVGADYSLVEAREPSSPPRKID